MGLRTTADLWVVSRELSHNWVDVVGTYIVTTRSKRRDEETEVRPTDSSTDRPAIESHSGSFRNGRVLWVSTNSRQRERDMFSLNASGSPDCLD